jgi:hypothetical protein
VIEIAEDIDDYRWLEAASLPITTKTAMERVLRLAIRPSRKITLLKYWRGS